MTTMPAHVRRPPGRYDQRRRLSRPVQVAAISLGLLVLLVGTYLVYDRFSNNGIRFATLGYVVRSDTEVDIRFQVTRDRETTVDCLVRARDRDGIEVGSQKVRVAAGEAGQVERVQRVTTLRRAAAGEVTECVVASPATRPPT
jgi:hypothetical protein